MTTGRFYTVWFSIIALCLILLYDGFAYIHYGVGATISRTLLYASPTHPGIPLFAGGLAAHLFWPGSTPVPRSWRLVAAGVVLGSFELAAAAGLVLFPLVSLVLGFFLGRLLVPQLKENT